MEEGEFYTKKKKEELKERSGGRKNSVLHSVYAFHAESSLCMYFFSFFGIAYFLLFSFSSLIVLLV